MEAHHQIINFLDDLVASSDRRDEARRLAALIGADDLILFTPDPDVGVFLPVPGFPQTLHSGGQWRDFLAGLPESEIVRRKLPSPFGDATVEVAAIASHGTVAALLGGSPCNKLLADLASILPLAGHAFKHDRKLLLFNSDLQQMRSEVKNACVLTSALDQLRRELEQALQLASRETAAAEIAKQNLLKANEELALARDQALAASHAKSAFLANMSHELRTPLTAIIGYAEMLLDEATDELMHTDLHRIKDAGQHLLGLVNDILDMAKIEAGRVEVQAEDFSIEEVAHEAIEIVTPQMADHGNTCTVQVVPGIPQLHTDRGKLRQVLLNLLSNAAKFTENGTVTLSAAFESGTQTVVICVADTGMGIAESSLKKLFHEFSQIDSSSTKKSPGTGLGLAISQRLCILLGGRITVTSAFGTGSTFKIEIPHTLPAKKQPAATA